MDEYLETDILIKAQALDINALFQAEVRRLLHSGGWAESDGTQVLYKVALENVAGCLHVASSRQAAYRNLRKF